MVCFLFLRKVSVKLASNLKSHIKGYHAYMKKWNQIIGEKARLEPENEYDKFVVAVEKCGAMVEHLTKGKTGRISKKVSFFLRASDGNCCHVEVTGQRVNLNDGEGLQIPCTLHSIGEAKYINKLKDMLSSLI